METYRDYLAYMIHVSDSNSENKMPLRWGAMSIEVQEGYRYRADCLVREWRELEDGAAAARLETKRRVRKLSPE